jgi:Domain of unknown function (DUF932)
MVQRAAVDLSSHINETVEAGNPADFPIILRPVYHGTGGDGEFEAVPERFAVVRKDTGKTLAIVSDRYKVVRHQELLDAVQAATTEIDVGPIPRGIYVDRDGARMRALFKFPALEQPIAFQDHICPCVKIENTYNATSKILVHIGAFRFVCTNLAVGGGGVFAGGFMSIHAGQIDTSVITTKLKTYLTDFNQIMATYRQWAETEIEAERHEQLLDLLPARSAEMLKLHRAIEAPKTVFDAYNQATNYATHHMRSFHGAFDLLERINHGFQNFFPISRN